MTEDQLTPGEPIGEDDERGESGLLIEVRWEWDGTITTEPYSVGATSVHVEDPLSLAGEETIWIGGTGPYTIQSVDEATGWVEFGPPWAPYDDLDPDEDPDGDEGDPVVPDIGGGPAQVWVAEVLLLDSETTIEVPLTVHDLAVMPEGVYDPPKAVLVAHDYQSVVDLPGSIPAMDGRLLIPGTVPQTPSSDGEPPEGSPAVTLSPLYSTLMARWPEQPNADLVGYEVWMSGGGFPASQVATVYGTLAQISAEPDGTPLEKGIDYTVWVHAFDVDGHAPGPGAPDTSRIAAISREDLQQQVVDELEAAADAAAQALADAAAAQAAADAAVQEDDIANLIEGYTVEYAVGSSETVPPTTGWSEDTPTRTPGTFIWTRTTVHRADGSSSQTSPALLTGNTGEPGEPGSPGEPGEPGEPGRGITGTTVTYAKSGSGTTPPSSWQESIPATSPGEYLWTRTVTTYTSGDPTTAYSVAAHGEDGAPGSPGDPGEPGAPGEPGVGISGTTVRYAKSTDGINPPTSGWGTTIPATSPGEFLWTRTVTTYTAGDPTTAYSVAAHGQEGPPGAPGDPGEPGPPGEPGEPGEPGSDGADGISVTAITPYYARVAEGAAVPDKPGNVETPPAPWQATEPDLALGTVMYRTDKVNFSNGTRSYTTVVRSSTYDAAVEAMEAAQQALADAYDAAQAAGQAQDAANGKNAVWYLPAAPPGSAHAENDLWFDTSPDPTTGQPMNLPHRWDGDSWEPQPLGNAAIGNLDAAKITAGYLDVANRIEAGSMGVDKLDADVIVADETYAQEGYFGAVSADQITTGEVEATLGLFGDGGIEVGPNIRINPDEGIYVESVAGVTQFPADGSEAVISGALRTNQFVVQKHHNVNGEENVIAGALGLEDVVVAPTVKPSLNWTRPMRPSLPFSSFGLTTNPTGSNWVVVDNDTNTLKVYRKTDHALMATYSDPAWRNLYWAHSVTRVGDFYFIVGEDKWTLDVWVLRLNSSGNLVGRWQVASDSYAYGRLGIGTDMSGNVMVGVIRASDTSTVNVSRWTPGGVAVGEGVVYELGFNTGFILGLGEDPIGPGSANRVWIQPSGAIVTFTAPTERELYVNYAYRGMWYDDAEGGFWATHRNGLVFLNTDNYWPDPVEVEFTWYDSDPAGTGTHETDPGPSATFKPQPWSYLTVTTPPPPYKGNPDDPDSIRVYIDGHKQPDLPPGTSQVAYRSVEASGIAPPTENGFAGATSYPGRIVSKSEDSNGPIIALNGDGSGRIGEQRWGADGVLLESTGLVGEIKMLANTLLTPIGWVVCDGRALSRTEYARLFNVIGTTYGAGDGSSTFNVPDFRDRFPMGEGEHHLGQSDGVSFGPTRTDLHNMRHNHGSGTLATSQTQQTGTRQNGTNSTVPNANHVHAVTGSTAISGITPLPRLAVMFFIKY